VTAENLMTAIGTLVSVTDDGPDDIYGQPTPTVTESTVRYELQQQRRDETGDPGAWQMGTWRLFLPANTSAKGADRFISADGVEFDFDGPPWHVRNPRNGRTSHIEATLRAVS